MAKIIKTVKMETEDRDYLERHYVDYAAKQDLLNSIFELHKFDEDDTVISSVPFQSYHKKFAESKLAYDLVMKEIQEKYIPKELQDKGCRWEVDFGISTIVISEM